ncbi:MAG: ABC transporter permease subunit [Alphaproteobacteria bacterium]|nr:ABC transporter permease subunit [Alphaproteobacteria bacterium]
MTIRGQKLTLIDFVIFACVVAAIGYVAYRVENVLIYKWDWSAIPSYLFRWDEATGSLIPNLLIKGLVTTIRITFWTMLVASIIDVVLGIARTSSRLFPRLVSWAYVEFIRNIPPVPFLFLFYFFIASQVMPLLGIDDAIRDMSPGTKVVAELLFGPANLISNFASGVVSLSMMAAAYIAEIVRAGVLAVPKGQLEAGHSIGLSHLQSMRYIVLPQAVARVVPPLAGQFITLIKDSSLVALISIQELSFLAMEIAISEQRFFEVWIVTGAMYFVVCYSCALVFGRLERRIGVHRR